MKRVISLMVALAGVSPPLFAADFNPETWAGNWYGVWYNSTYGSTGPVVINIGVDPGSKTLYYTFDAGGNVFGQSDPAPFGGSGPYTNAGSMVTFNSNVLGTGEADFGADNTLSSTADSIPDPGIDGLTVNGVVNNGLLSIDYLIDFTSGTDPDGFGKSIRRPIPPLNLGDLNGNKAEEIAALEMDANGNQKVFVKDSKTRKRVALLNYRKASRPVAMVRVPDINGNRKPEVALLLVNNTTGAVRTVIKDGKTGKTLRTLRYNAKFAPVDMVFVPGKGLGVLGMDENGMVQVQIKSHKTAKQVGLIDFGSTFYASNIAFIPGKNPAVAAAGIRRNDYEATVVAEVRNVNGGSLVNTLEYGKRKIPLQLLVENQATLSMLTYDTLDDTTSLLRRKWETDTAKVAISYADTTIPKQVAMVGNTGGRKAADIAYLSVGRTTGAVKVKINDSVTRKQVRGTTYGKAFKPGGMVKLKNTGGGTAADLAVHGSRANNVSRLELRDLKTRNLVRTISVP